MSKTSLIIKREYITRVKKKSFLITTFLAPILFVGVIAAVIYLGISDSKNYNILLEDTTHLMSENVNGSIVPINPDRWKNKKDSSMTFQFTDQTMSTAEFLESEYNLLISFDEQTLNDENVPMLYKDLPSARTSISIERKMQDEFQEITLYNLEGITPEEYKKAKVSINLIEQDAENLEETDESMRERGWIGYVFAIIIYMTILLFGSQVMRGVIEEKMNRIVEVLISSVKPFQLLMGKIIGVGLVGLTQFVMWIALTVVLFFIAGAVISSTIDLGEATAQLENGANMMENDQLMEQLNLGGMSSGVEVITSANWPLILGCFLFFFLGGYLLYGSLLAAIGSAVDAEADAQQFMVPITIPLIAALMISQLLIENPESSAATFFSIFPLTSPVVMLVRVAMNNFAIWELVLSMFLLVVTFIGTVWLSGKIYRTGILMHGKKVSYKELWKWLRY